jgi:molybdenum cofactor cytidylyltransferase
MSKPAPSLGVVGLVLAAGASRRMGEATNKLCLEVDGKALVAGPVDAMLDAGIDTVFVVTGYQRSDVRSALGGRAIIFLDHPGWGSGMGSSIAAGLRGILTHCDPSGVLICVGDLAGLRGEWLQALCNAFAETLSAGGLCVPTYEGRFGHPVLFGRRYFDELLQLDGEAGGRSILRANDSLIRRVPIDSDAILRDLDTPRDFESRTSKGERD